MAFVSDLGDRSEQQITSQTMRLTVACALLVIAAIMVLRGIWDGFPPDLSAIYMAAHVYGAGLPELMYNAPPQFFNGVPPDWVPLLPELGLTDKPVLPYVYPPIWAVLLSPLTQAIGPYTFFNTMAVIELTCMLASVGLCWRMARRFALPAWSWVLLTLGLMMTSVITFGAVMHLQPQIVVVFLILLAFERYSSGKFALAGAVLGMAAALKLAPAALVLIFLLDRQWRSFVAFSVTCAALGALSLILAGVQLHLDFLASAAAASATPLVTALAYSAEIPIYAAAATLDLAPPITAGAADFRLPEIALVQILSKALLILCLGWAIFATAKLDADRRLVARLFLFSLLINLFGPLGWAHYFLPQLFLLPALIGLLPFRIGAVSLITVATLTSHMALPKLQSLFQSDLGLACVGAGTMLALFCVVTANLRQRPQGTA